MKLHAFLCCTMSLCGEGELVETEEFFEGRAI